MHRKKSRGNARSKPRPKIDSPQGSEKRTHGDYKKRPDARKARPFGRPRKEAVRADRHVAEKRESGVRLQRFLASAGFGSRRHCEELIVTGRVEVDGQVVDTLGARVRPFEQKILVDGTRVRPPRKRVYLVNKPVGVLSTHKDPGGRTRVIDLIPHGDRYFTVGRLDRHSEGLILVTNDGDLANGLAHPRYGVTKTYRVEVAGVPDPEALAEMRGGIRLAEGTVRAIDIRILRQRRHSTILQMVLNEGKNREIRRMAAHLGHKVLSLRRIALGPLRLGDIPVGAFRELRSDEVDALWRTVRSAARPKQAPRPGGHAEIRAFRPKSRTPSKSGGYRPRRVPPAALEKGESLEPAVMVQRGKGPRARKPVGPARKPNVQQGRRPGKSASRPFRPKKRTDRP